MPRCATIPIDPDNPYEASAQILALLIFPGDGNSRQRFLDAGDYLAAVQAVSGPRAGNILVPGEYLRMTPQGAERCHKRGIKILNEERFVSAQMALPYLAEAIRYRIAGLREGGEVISETHGRPLSLDPLLQWGLRQQHRLRGGPGSPKDSENWNQVRQRAWKNSKPVLHLAVALDISTDAGTPEIRRDRMAALFSDPAQIEPLLTFAETIRLALLAIAAGPPRRFALTDAETISIRAAATGTTVSVPRSG